MSLIVWLAFAFILRLFSAKKGKVFPLRDVYRISITAAWSDHTGRFLLNLLGLILFLVTYETLFYFLSNK